MTKQSTFHPSSQAVMPAPDGDAGSALVTRGGSSDAAMLRVSVELAREYPRDEDRVLVTVLRTLDAYPQFAERALYSIPYKDGRTGETIRVEGLSIRAAETLATAWGHMRVGVRILREDEDGWDLEAVAFDMQANYWELTPSRASKWLKLRDGRMELLDDRRQIQARGAAVSKVKRNCVLSVLPLHLKAAFERRVREKMAGGDLGKPADATRVAAALAAFLADYGIDEDRIVAYVGKPRDLWVGEDLADLRAVYNALKDKEASVDDVFPAPEPTLDAPVRGRVVEVQEGALSPSAKLVDAPPMSTPPAPTTAKPVVPAKVEPPPPLAKAGTPQSPVGQETEVERLRRQLAEAEARAVAPPAPPAPVASQATTEAEALAAAIAECRTIADLDALLGRLYAPGGTLAEAKREVKRAALARIGQRRDEIQKAGVSA